MPRPVERGLALRTLSKIGSLKNDDSLIYAAIECDGAVRSK